MRKLWIGMAVVALAAAGCARVERVNVSDSGRPVTAGLFEPFVIDGDGRVTAFATSDFLTTDDQAGISDVFTRDLRAERTALASISPDGRQDPISSSHPSISGDGRFVSFTTSSINDLVPLPPGMIGTRIYVKDRATGALEQIAVPGEGTSTGDASLLDGDGRHVAFWWADIRSGGPGPSVTGTYVFDRTTQTLTAASVSQSGQFVGGLPLSISDDGRFVAFASTAAAVVTGSHDLHQHVFVRDLVLGTTSWVSVGADGTALAGDYDGKLSGDGSSLVLWNRGSPYHVFRKDLASGAVTQVDVRGCQPATPSTSYVTASISDDGRAIAFFSDSPDLVAGDGNGAEDVFLWRASRPCSVALISVDRHGHPGNGDSYWPAISGDGRSVAFASSASDLVSGDDNGAVDGFVWSANRGLHLLDGS